MFNLANVLANLNEEKPRKPGPPPGTSKVPGSGRRKGSKNQRTIDVQQAYGPAAGRMAKKLEQRFNEEMEKGAKANLDFCYKVWRDMAAYAYGRPTERREVSGPDGGPIERHTHLVETSQKIAAVFGQINNGDGKPIDGIAEQLGDSALGAVQSISYLMAARAAQASRDARSAPAEPRPLPRPAVAAVPSEPEPTPVPAQPVEPTPPPIHHALSFVESALSVVARSPDREGLPPCYELRRGTMLLRRAAWDVVLAEARKQSGGDLGPWLVQEPRP